MTDVLAAAGFDAINVTGGTRPGSAAGRPSSSDRDVPEDTETPRHLNSLTVRTVETPSLGDRSYVVHDGEVALVIDPQRDIDRVLDVLADATACG